MRGSTIAAGLLSVLLNTALVTAQAATAATTTTAAGAGTIVVGATGGTTATNAKATTTVTTARSTTSTSQRPAPTIPLTTIFTAPASCETIGFTYWTTTRNVTSAYWRNAYTGGDDASLTKPCYPDSFRALALQTGIYSPGVCPSGWHAAEVIQAASTAPWTSWCCPNTMTYDGLGCVSTVTTPTSIYVASGTQRPISGTWIAVDWPLRVVWESDDLSQFTPASAPILNAAVSASTKTSQATATDTNYPDADTSSSSQGLTGGAIAGIVIGALAGIAIILGLVWFLLRRRRRRASPQYGAVANISELQHEQKSELPGGGMGHELPAGGMQTELPASEKSRAELAGGEEGKPGHKVNQEPAELDGGHYDLHTTGQQRVNGTTYG